jgi:sulfite exporter TauE/SafE
MVTLPLALAALSAGAIGGVHCVGMCGGISTLLSQNGIAGRKVIAIASVNQSDCSAKSSVKNLRYQILLHSGRLLTYMLIGAVFGGLGGAGVLFKPYFPVQQILYMIGNIALVLLGLRLLGLKSAVSFLNRVGNFVQGFAHAILPGIRQSSPYPFLIGMSWGCLPCGLLFGIAPFAFLSGDVLSGALLMLLFGVAALPHLLLAQSLAKLSWQGRFAAMLRMMGAAILILIGLFGLWYFDMKDMPGFLCVTPVN